MKKYLLLIAIVMFVFSCKNKTGEEQPVVIEQVIPDIPDGLMKPETLWHFGRIGEFQVSPDGNSVVMTVAFFSIDQNKGNRELYVIDLKTKERTRITTTAAGEFNVLWRPDGEKIGFLYPDENGVVQLFECNADGSERKQISFLEEGLNGFSYSPDMKHILYFADVAKEPTTSQLHPDMPQGNVRIIDNLMYRHWDHWVESYSHIFVSAYSDKISEGKDILEGEEWEAPVRPFGGNEQVVWTPDGKGIVYTCRKLKGLAYSKSTNTDLYHYDIVSGKTVNLTEGLPGYDMNPVFSPDGAKLAWESMPRDGYEADKHRLMIRDMATGNIIDLTEQFDANVHNIVWSPDGSEIYFTTDWYGSKEIFKISIEGGEPERITEGIHDYMGIALSNHGLVAMKQSMSFRTNATLGLTV